MAGAWLGGRPVLLWPGGGAVSTALADADRGRLDRELDQAVESAKAWCRVVLACRRGGRRRAAIEARLLRGAALEWDSEPLVEDAISRSLS